MTSNFSFGLVAFSDVNGILVLLAQTIITFPLYPIILGLWGHFSSLKLCRGYIACVMQPWYYVLSVVVTC